MLAALLALPSIASAQITIDGHNVALTQGYHEDLGMDVLFYANHGEVQSATVFGMRNDQVLLDNYGIIHDATVVRSSDTFLIGRMAFLVNNEGATINNLTLNSTVLPLPVWVLNVGTLNNVTLNGGARGMLMLDHWDGIINNLTLNGGYVSSCARIDHMIYTDGTFQGWSGTIGTLILSGDTSLNMDEYNVRGNWGIVENVVFASDGSGILTISAEADSMSIGFSVDGMEAQSIDLTGGNVVVDLTGLVSEGTKFTLFDLFDTANVFGTLSSLSIGGQEFSSVGTNSAFTYIDGAWYSTDVPEPATLAILALGLTGLGFARRRK